MAKTTLFKGVVYLSDEQYNKLITDGVIEVGGQTITYDESMVYITPKALPTDYYTKSEVDEKLKTVFDNVTYIDNSYGEQSVLYDNVDGITVMQTTRVSQNDKTSDISSEMTIPLVGSEEIVFDATEDGKHIQAHLDADIKNKLDKTLVTPTSTPTATELVAVDNTNSQTMLAIGDGLSVENGTLKASGGYKLYLHVIHGSNIQNKGSFYANIISKESTGYSTRKLLNTFLKNSNITSLASPYACIGYDSANVLIRGIYSVDDTRFGVGYLNLNDGSLNGSVVNIGTITDTVTEL